MILCFAGCSEARRRRGVGRAGVLLALALLTAWPPRAQAGVRLQEGVPNWDGINLDVQALNEAGWGISLEASGHLPLDPSEKATSVTLTAGDNEQFTAIMSSVFDTVFGPGCGAPVGAYKAVNTEWHNANLSGGGCRAIWDLSIAKPEAGLMLVGSVIIKPGGLWGAFRLAEPVSGEQPATDLTLALVDLPGRALSIGMVQSRQVAGGQEWSVRNWPHDRVLSIEGHRPWSLGVRAWSDGQVYLLMAGVLRRSPNISAIPLWAPQFGKDPIESCLPRFEGFPEVWEVDLVSPDLSEPVTPEATLAAVLDGALGRSPLTGKAKAFRLFGSREWSQARPEAPPLAVRKLLGLADGFTCPTLHVRGDRVLGDVTAGLVRMQPGDDTHNGWPNRLAEARALVQWVSGDGYVALTTLNPSDALDARTPGGAPWGDSALSRNAPSEFGKTHGQYVLEGLLGQLGQGLCWLPWDVEAAGDRTHVRLTPDPEAQVGYPTRSRLGDTVWGGVQMWVDGVVTHTVIPTER